MKNSADQGGCYPPRPSGWITLSEICRILHILRKPNSIIASLFIQNISPFLMEFRRFALLLTKITISSPGFFGQRLNNLQQAPLLTSFWRQRLNNLERAPLLTSLIEYDELILSKFGEQQLVMVNYASGFNQSETGKYFERIIINNYSMSARGIWDDW